MSIMRPEWSTSYRFANRTVLVRNHLSTFQVAQGTKAIRVQCYGAGGGGGGGVTGASAASIGGGGGSGSYSESWLCVDATITALTYGYAVGQGGAGGVAGNNAGS